MTRARVIQSYDIKPQKPLREISVRRVTRNINSSLTTDCKGLKHKDKGEQRHTKRSGGNLNDLLGF